MAAGAWVVYSNAIELIHEGAIDLDEDDFRMVLVTEEYSPDADADDTWSDVSTNDVANGNGYTTHGEALTVTVTRNAGTVTIDCDDQSWENSTITAKYAVIVRDDDGNGQLASTDALIAYADLDTGGGSVSTTNGTFAVTINASGVFTVARA